MLIYKYHNVQIIKITAMSVVVFFRLIFGSTFCLYQMYIAHITNRISNNTCVAIHPTI